MKTAVVYYSLEGSTRLAAQVIAERLGADLFELHEKRQRKTGFALFAGGGFAAALGVRSRLKDNFGDRMKEYDRIFAGAPIWASSPAPALNTFLHAVEPRGKQLILFTVQADPNTDAPPQKSMEKRCALLRKKGADVLPVLRLYGASPGKTATKESMEKQLGGKLKNFKQ